jgi:hypothetical protein
VSRRKLEGFELTGLRYCWGFPFLGLDSLLGPRLLTSKDMPWLEQKLGNWKNPIDLLFAFL